MYNDIYYRPWGDYYVVCRPPYGVFFRPTLVDLAIDAAVRFSYYNRVARTYSIINDNWNTIAEQNAIIAQNNAAIAAGNAAYAAESERLSSQSYQLASSLGLIQSFADASVEYYYEDGVFFVKDVDGQYKVIVPPAGALVSTLPEDYETVVLGGAEYYKVDDTIYRTVVVDGDALFEVLGQVQ